MMRFKYALIAGALVLALPLVAQAQILRGARCGCGLFGGRVIGGGGGGGAVGGKINAFFGAIGDAIANSPGPVWPEKTKDKQGLGFFQPPFQASPWYVYWPYDQHFQLPAPINAPYFAPQMYAHPSMNQYFPGAPHGVLPHPAPAHPPGAPVVPPPK